MAVITFPNPTPANEKNIYDGIKAITPSDADTFAQPVRIRCGGAGNLVASPANGQPDVTIAVIAGELTLVRYIAVKATGTTATLIHAVY